MPEVRPPLSIVMPAWNEAEGIEAAVAEVRRCVLDAVPGSELLVVDDGSSDGTGEILERLTREEPRLRCLRCPHGGHGPALLAGLAAARGERVLLLDSDQEIPLDGFAELWEAARSCDALLGVRARRTGRGLRRLLSSLLRLAIRGLHGVDLRDANAPFKILDARLWQDVRERIPPDCPVPSVLLAVHAARAGGRVLQVAVPHRARPHGSSALAGAALPRLAARAAASLLSFRRAAVGRPSTAAGTSE